MATISGLFSTAEAAEVALQALKAEGTSDDKISVMYSGNVGSEDLDRQRFTGERAARVIAEGNQVEPALAQIGLRNDLVQRYARSLENDGAILLTVRADEASQKSNVQQILEKAGAESTAISGKVVPIEHPEPEMTTGRAKRSA